MGREGGSLGRIEIEIPQCEAGNGKEKEGGGDGKRARKQFGRAKVAREKSLPFLSSFGHRKRRKGESRRGER